ncbi:MAG: hypothetical protein HGA44_17825 [Cellulomonadaceae bacterium]|nr:hypothetical protein [Cellulomonadaceae bacterium]
MANYSFDVDLGALVAASRGMSSAIELMRAKDVADLVPDGAALGHDAVRGATAEFVERWERGITTLVQDVDELAGRLGRVAMNYADMDTAGQTALSAVTADVRAVRVMAS